MLPQLTVIVFFLIDVIRPAISYAVGVVGGGPFLAGIGASKPLAPAGVAPIGCFSFGVKTSRSLISADALPFLSNSPLNLTNMPGTRASTVAEPVTLTLGFWSSLRSQGWA